MVDLAMEISGVILRRQRQVSVVLCFIWRCLPKARHPGASLEVFAGVARFRDSTADGYQRSTLGHDKIYQSTVDCLSL